MAFVSRWFESIFCRVGRGQARGTHAAELALSRETPARICRLDLSEQLAAAATRGAVFAHFGITCVKAVNGPYLPHGRFGEELAGFEGHQDAVALARLGGARQGLAVGQHLDTVSVADAQGESGLLRQPIGPDMAPPVSALAAASAGGSGRNARATSIP